MKTLLLVILLICCSTLLAQSPTTEPVVACIGAVTNPQYSTAPSWWRYSPIALEAWEQLQAVEGASIWLGYGAGGYVVPEDCELVFKIGGVGEEGQRVLVWVWWAESQPDTFWVFPFRNIQPYADANGQHYGIHPCGMYTVEADDLQPILAAINGDE